VAGVQPLERAGRMPTIVAADRLARALGTTLSEVERGRGHGTKDYD